MKVKNKNLVKVWNVTLKSSGKTIRVATIEQLSRQETMCAGCSAPCCKGLLQPVMNSEEFHSRKFQMKFIPSPPWLKKLVERADYLAVLKVTKDGCIYHDNETNLCTIWPNCPASCLRYDCRQDDRPEISIFAKEREKTWQEA